MNKKITISGIELSEAESAKFREQLIEKTVDNLCDKIYSSITNKQASDIFNTIILPKLKIDGIKIDPKKINDKLNSALEELLEDNFDQLFDERPIIKKIKEKIKISIQ